MSAPKVFGWCPGALRPMMSGDGLVVRVRAPMGRLTQSQAEGIADLSERCGNGLLDLSSRANLQIRGVTEEAHEDLIDGLRSLGLIDADVSLESRRNLVIQPFWTDGDTTDIITRQLTRGLTAEDAPDLPGKFGFAIDCGPFPILSDISADIRIEHGRDGLICRPDGASAGCRVTVETAAAAALSLAHWFLATGGAPDGRGRMAAHVSRVGTPDTFDAPMRTTVPRPGPGPTSTGCLVALEFGQMQARTLAALAKHGALRLTPWRMVLVEGTDQIMDMPDIITDPSDPRLRVTACTGAPGCPQARSTTRDIARRLAGYSDGHLHVAGCAKGCAHPGPAARTLVATGQGRFDLIRDGRTTDPAIKTGLSLIDLQRGEL